MYDANKSLEPLVFENVTITCDNAYKRIVEFMNNGTSYFPLDPR